MENLNFEQLKISAMTKWHHIQKNNLQAKQETTKDLRNDVVEDTKVDSNYGAHIIPVRYMLRELEVQRQAQVNNAIKTKLNELKTFSVNCSKKAGQEWLQQQQSFINKQLQKENAILNELSQYDKVSTYRKEEELREKQRVLKETVEKCVKLYKEFSNIYQEILEVLKNCDHQDEVKKLCYQEIKQCSSTKEVFEKVLELCKSHSVSQVNVKVLVDSLLQFKLVKEKIKATVEEVCAHYEKLKTVTPPPPPEVKEKQSVVNQPTQPINVVTQLVVPQPTHVAVQPTPVAVPSPVALQPTPVPLHPTPVAIQPTPIAVQPIPVATKSPQTNPGAPKDTTDASITQFVGINNLKRYKDLMTFAYSHSASFKTLVEDNTYKQFKFDCKKAVNIPVSAISAVNSSHLLDKYNRLHKLLSGQMVTISDQHINASKHPNGMAFCTDLLAKKFVLQADLMISSNPEAAFCYATIISSLWNDFPDLGKLILAYLYKSCPYLVPYYIPQRVGQSDEDYYQSRGYQYNDGEIEKQDKFLKRMTGIMRLYSALLITKPKRGHKLIPHNLENGWRWLTSVLKLQPEVDITATMLHVFLETTGYSMEKAYGSSFTKVMKILLQQFMPICSKQCTGGATTRLENLLSNYLKTGHFESPSGFLESPTW